MKDLLLGHFLAPRSFITFALGAWCVFSLGSVCLDISINTIANELWISSPSWNQLTSLSLRPFAHELLAEHLQNWKDFSSF